MASFSEFLHEYFYKKVTDEIELHKEKTDLKKLRKHNHYFKDVSELTEIDIYKILMLYQVTDPCLQHTIKKCLLAGRRGGKTFKQDVIEALDTLKRRVEIMDQDLPKEPK